jgi:hypothetical protein
LIKRKERQQRVQAASQKICTVPRSTPKGVPFHLSLQGANVFVLLKKPSCLSPGVWDSDLSLSRKSVDVQRAKRTVRSTCIIVVRSRRAANDGKKNSSRRRTPKTVLHLPELDQAKSAVLNSLSSAEAQRGYRPQLMSSWSGIVPNPGCRSIRQ